MQSHLSSAIRVTPNALAGVYASPLIFAVNVFSFSRLNVSARSGAICIPVCGSNSSGGNANAPNNLFAFTAVTSVPFKCVMTSPGLTPAFCAGLPGITRLTRHNVPAGAGTASGRGTASSHPIGARCPSAVLYST